MINGMSASARGGLNVCDGGDEEHSDCGQENIRGQRRVRADSVSSSRKWHDRGFPRVTRFGSVILTRGGGDTVPAWGSQIQI